MKPESLKGPVFAKIIKGTQTLFKAISLFHILAEGSPSSSLAC